jgi:hypothetical protein
MVMTAIAYGVCNHSPNQFFEWVGKAYTKKCELISSSDSASKHLRNRGSYVFLDYRSFVRHLNVANLCSAICVVFCSPLKLFNLQGVYALDMEYDQSAPFYGIKVLNDMQWSVWQAAKPQTVQITTSSYAANIVAQVSSTSILNELMTLIYSLPAATHQKPVKMLVANWLHGDKSEAKLKRELDTLCESLRISQATRDRLLAVLLSDMGKRYKAAFRDLTKARGKPKYDKLASKHNVSAYDMRYIVSLASKSNS